MVRAHGRAGGTVGTNILQQAIINGDAYRVSQRRTLADGETLPE